jgi:hypothetical protein
MSKPTKKPSIVLRKGKHQAPVNFVSMESHVVVVR